MQKALIQHAKDRGAEAGAFLFSKAPRQALGPTQPPLQWAM